MHHTGYGRLALSLCLIAFLLVSGSSSVISLFPSGEGTATDTLTNTISITYRFPPPTISRHQGADRIHMPGLLTLAAPGNPRVPVKPVRLLLPPGHIVRSVNVSGHNKTVAGTDIHLPVAQMPVPLMDTTPPRTGDIENATPSHPYPVGAYTMTGVHPCRGYAILTLQLHPVRYTAATGTLSSYETMTVTVTTTETGHDNPLFRDNAADAAQVADMVDNPDMIQQYPLSSEDAPRRDGNQTYDYVIITSDSLQSTGGKYTLQELADSKAAQGMNATIVTVDNITSTPSYWNATPLFNDTQAQIRAFIRHAYLNWSTEYVLLAGDGDTGNPVIPARKFYATAHGAPASRDYTGSIPSDVYYACLDGNWNQDQDDRWGENASGNAQGQDEADFYAEIYVGRAPLDSPAEVSNFVRKTLAYQQANDTSLEKVLLLGEYLGFGDVADFGGTYLDELIDGSTAHGYTTTGIPDAGYNISTLYDRDWPGFDATSPYSSGWPASTLTALINNGVHIINHFGHGSITTAMKMTMSDITALTNTHYPFVYSQTCLAGAFDSDDCFAEQLVGSTHGAFAAVMNTRQGWGAYNSTDGPSHRYNREFWDAVYNESIPRLGNALQDAKEDNVWRINQSCMRWCYYETTLFGDPSLAIQSPPPDTEQPVISAVDAQPSVQEKQQPVTISATVSDNIAVADVFLTVTAPNGTTHNVSMQHTRGGETYCHTVTQDLVGNYSYSIWASDSNGNSRRSATHQFRIVPVRQVFHFQRGWNVFTIPVQANYTAKTLGSAVSHCAVVAGWNASAHTFDSFVVNVSPDAYNFALAPGYAYEVYVKHNTTFTVTGNALSNISVDLYAGLNALGWFHAWSTTASSLGAAIDDCIIVSTWNATSQSFHSFVVGHSPPPYDFIVERGMGVYIYTESPGIWHGAIS